MMARRRTLADDWKATAAKWKRRHDTQKRWTVGLAIANGVIVLLALVALTAKIASQQPTIQYAKEPVPTSIEVAEYTPAHILACVKMKNGGTRCSGTVISQGAEYAAILSAAHCVVGNIGGKATFVNPDKSEFQAELLAVDRSNDICLFRGPADKVLGHSFVPHRYPSDVKQWEACGYTAAGGLKYKKVHPIKTNINNLDAIYWVDEGPFAGGDSGGSVFADSGLVGVISARENGPASNKFNKQIHCGCTHSNMLTFLRKHNDKLAGCGPWGCPPNRRGDGYRQRPPDWNPGDNIPINPPPKGKPDIQPQPDFMDDLAKKFDDINQRIDDIQLKPGANGSDGQPGPPGSNGKDGKDGVDGRGISSTTINQNGELLIVYSDGTTTSAGAVKGPQGEPGIDGARGTVTVLIKEANGETLYRLENLKPGTEVDVPVKRSRNTTESGG